MSFSWSLRKHRPTTRYMRNEPPMINVYPGGNGPDPQRLISSCRVEIGPGHDRVHVWNRGGKAGVLTVNKEEGLFIAKKLIGSDAKLFDYETGAEL